MAAHKAGLTLSVLVALVGATIAMGAAKPDVQLQQVADRADTIVAGTVASVEATEGVRQVEQAGRTYEFAAWRARLRIEQTIKGRPATNEIVVEFPGPTKDQQGVFSGPLPFLEDLGAGERVVAYLSAQHGGAYYSFANDYRSAVRISRSESVTQLLQSRPPQVQADDFVASLVAASICAASRATIEQGVSDLVDLKGAQAAPALKTALQHSEDMAIRAVILTGLLRIGDCSELPSAIECVSADVADQFVLGTQTVLGSAMSLVGDSQLIREHYYPLLRHPKEFVRRSAAYAIRKAKLKDAVPYLIEGLKDADQNTRYECLMGLAELLGRGGDWAPSKESFRNNEREHINLWQAWWTSSGQFEFAKAVAGEETPVRTPVDEGPNGRSSPSDQVMTAAGPSQSHATPLAGDDGGANTPRPTPGSEPSANAERNALPPGAGDHMPSSQSLGDDAKDSLLGDSANDVEEASWWLAGLLAVMGLATVLLIGAAMRRRRRRGAPTEPR